MGVLHRPTHESEDGCWIPLRRDRTRKGNKLFKLRRPSPALVIAVVALFVGLGGGAYAANKIGTNNLKNNAVTSKKIKNNAVNSNKIKDSAVTSKKIKNGEVKGEDLGGGTIYDYGPGGGKLEPPFGEPANSENKSATAECPEGKVVVTAGVSILPGQIAVGSNPDPAPGKIAISESFPVFSGPGPGTANAWIVKAIEVNGGTSEDWRLNLNLICGKVADG